MYLCQSWYWILISIYVSALLSCGLLCQCLTFLVLDPNTCQCLTFLVLDPNMYLCQCLNFLILDPNQCLTFLVLDPNNIYVSALLSWYWILCDDKAKTSNSMDQNVGSYTQRTILTPKTDYMLTLYQPPHAGTYTYTSQYPLEFLKMLSPITSLQ
jgi:hypothetical protein